MKERNLDAYMIPSEDQHMSEYVPECYQRREWISQFTGSAGMGARWRRRFTCSDRHDEGGAAVDGLALLFASLEAASALLDPHEDGKQRLSDHQRTVDCPLRARNG